MGRRTSNRKYRESAKGIRKNKISLWKYRGLKENKLFMNQIYDEYLKSKECELCGEPYSKHNKKHMDHDHYTGKFRNICCARCNSWKADRVAKNIVWDNYIGSWQITVVRLGEYIIRTTRKKYDDAVKVLADTKLKYPWYFT